jgi:hypothetical protein
VQAQATEMLRTQAQKRIAARKIKLDPQVEKDFRNTKTLEELGFMVTIKRRESSKNDNSSTPCITDHTSPNSSSNQILVKVKQHVLYASNLTSESEEGKSKCSVNKPIVVKYKLWPHQKIRMVAMKK